MLRWALTFLIIAIIAAIFGFGGIVEGVTTTAQSFFYIFIILCVISFFAGKFQSENAENA
jgi:uncharacterized membrane protein YtjA (UPF0391 family)